MGGVDEHEPTEAFPEPRGDERSHVDVPAPKVLQRYVAELRSTEQAH